MSLRNNDPRYKLIHHTDYFLSIDSAQIIVRDWVFTPDPTITYSSSQIINNLPNVRGKTILDLGSGTWVVGIICLQGGASSAVFADNDLLAIENTKENILRNWFQGNITIIKSDLFEDISQQFDYIFANLPILPSVWEWYDDSLLDRFLRDCKKYIVSGGKVFFTTASFIDIGPIKELLDCHNYKFSLIEEEKLWFVWYLFEIHR